MQLSVIIVNYNVKHFLLQCLQSVYAAVNDLEMEVFVVDNVSKDGSVEAVRAAFPHVKLIANTENVGFSKANNQAIAQATGEYILILNPDTVVAEDTFVKCIAHMLSFKDTGCLGVHMIDGKGVFLPESKRGLPTPEVAFYKMFGFSSLFPKSKRFGKYHLGYLSENETHEVDILSGAFMFFRKEVLDKIGGFDETFFMYGEDIDLSWRVILGGYKNYYLADATIIHYKGESTKRGSLNYVKVFYEAMIIFAKKHFANSKASLFSFFINVAVVFRAILTIFANVISSSFVVVVDFLLIYAGLFFTTNFWANNFKSTIDYYPQIFLLGVLPMYILTWLTGAYLSGGYEKPFRLSGIVKGILASTFVIAFVYAFLPETWRFSRAIILFGAIVSMASLTITRLFYNMVKHGRLSFDEQMPKRWLIVGDETESSRAIDLLKKYEEPELTYTLSTANGVKGKSALLSIDEVVFCSKTVPFRTIIDSIEETNGKQNFKILNPDSNALIGSNSKNTAGDLLAEDKRLNLSKHLAQRKKRMLDIVLCSLLPFTFKSSVYSNLWAVLSGKKTWAGYITNEAKSLPFNKEAVFPIVKGKNIMDSDAQLLNELYAKNFTLTEDLKIIAKQI